MTNDYAIYPTYAISDARNLGEANRNYAHYYTLAADVTGIVQRAGFGSYSVANSLRWEPSFTYPDYTGEYPGGDSVGAWQLVIVAQYDMEITLPDGAAAYKKYTLDGVNVTPDVLSGLLSPDSVPETEIQETSDNIRNNRAVQTYYFTHEDILAMKEFVAENGMGNTKKEDALQRFFEQFMVPNLVQ